MALHCAKGLQFGEVYRVGMEDGLLSNERSADEVPSLSPSLMLRCYFDPTSCSSTTFRPPPTRHQRLSL
jgi:hypothetical protein